MRRRSLKLQSIFLILSRITILIITALAFIIIYHYLFTITTIHCHFAANPCPDSIIIELTKLKGQNLLFFNQSTTTTKITNSSPLIESTNLLTSLPGQLTAQLTPANLIAQLATASSSASLLISTNFIITDYSPQHIPDLPLVISPSATSYHIQDIIPPGPLTQTISLSSALHHHLLPVTSVNLNSDQSALVLLDSGTQVFFNLNQPFKTQINTLHLILDQGPPDVSQIDLRYNKPVIRRSTD